MSVRHQTVLVSFSLVMLLGGCSREPSDIIGQPLRVVDRADSGNTGEFLVDLPRGVPDTVSWAPDMMYEYGECCWSAAALFDSLLYFSQSGGVLAVLDPDSFALRDMHFLDSEQARQTQAPVVVSDSLVLIHRRNSTALLETSTGDFRWRFDGRHQIDGLVLVDSTVVLGHGKQYVGTVTYPEMMAGKKPPSGRPELVGLDFQTGVVKWTVSLESNITFRPSILNDTLLAITGSEVVSIDPHEGRVFWHHSRGGRSLIANDGGLYVREGETVRRLRLIDGESVWETSVSSWDGPPAIASDEFIFVASNKPHPEFDDYVGTSLLALDLKTGTSVWDILIEDHFVSEYATSSLIKVGELLLLSLNTSDSGLIKAIDSRNGKTIWDLVLPVPIENAHIVPTGEEVWVSGGVEVARLGWQELD